MTRYIIGLIWCLFIHICCWVSMSQYYVSRAFLVTTKQPQRWSYHHDSRMRMKMMMMSTRCGYRNHHKQQLCQAQHRHRFVCKLATRVFYSNSNSNTGSDNDDFTWAVVEDFNPGNYKNTSLWKLSSVETDQVDSRINATTRIHRYRLEASLPKSEVRIYLDQYRDEIKRRRSIIPGFRPGVLSPIEMSKARKFVVVFGIESLLNKLLYLNGLRLCHANGTTLSTTNDKNLLSIVQAKLGGDITAEVEPNKSTTSVVERLQSWKEYMHFPFVADFYAESDVMEMIPASTTSNPIDQKVTADSDSASISEGMGSSEGDTPSRRRQITLNMS